MQNASEPSIHLIGAVLLCFTLFVGACSGSADGGGSDDDATSDTSLPESSGTPSQADNADADTGNALSQADAIARARESAVNESSNTRDFVQRSDVAIEANREENFWRVDFTADDGSVQVYLVADSGQLAQVATTGAAIGD